MAEEVSGVTEGVDRKVDLFPAQGARASQGLHQLPKLERVQAVTDGEQRGEEAFRLVRKAVHVGEVARLVHLVDEVEGYAYTSI